MTRLDRGYHLTMLGTAFVATVLPFFLSIDGHGKVATAGMPLPPMCISNDVFHVPCPGCGLTRSFVLLCHGDWQGANHLHRLGIAFFVLLALNVPWRLFVLLARPRIGPREVRLLVLIPRIVVVALVANWLWNATHGWPF